MEVKRTGTSPAWLAKTQLALIFCGLNGIGLKIDDAGRGKSGRKRLLSAAPPPAAAGRNERCPCNSGKKFKRCCALNALAAAPRMH